MGGHCETKERQTRHYRSSECLGRVVLGERLVGRAGQLDVRSDGVALW